MLALAEETRPPASIKRAGVSIGDAIIRQACPRHPPRGLPPLREVTRAAMATPRPPAQNWSLHSEFRLVPTSRTSPSSVEIGPDNARFVDNADAATVVADARSTEYICRPSVTSPQCGDRSVSRSAATDRTHPVSLDTDNDLSQTETTAELLLPHAGSACTPKICQRHSVRPSTSNRGGAGGSHAMTMPRSLTPITFCRLQ